MNTVSRLSLVCLAVAGCAKEREPAPTEMVDLVRFVFEHFEEDELLPEAVDNLDAWLQVNVDSEESKDGFRLQPLEPADVAGVDHPDVPLTDLIGACGGARSPFPLDRHATHMVLADQVFSNPGTYDEYYRAVEGDDDAFLDGTGVIRTANDVTTTTLGITVSYVLLKDYKWVEGETSRAVVARSWSEKPYCNDAGGTCLQQTYSVDIFFDGGATETGRMTAAWNQLDSSLPLGEDTLVATLAIGIQNVFKYTDEFLAGE
ncbi:MAG: hypothetical protein ABMA64_21995 [Myxococcota bacterium]